MNRYAPGGDLYDELARRYGQAGADSVYRASLTGRPMDITEAIATLKVGPRRDDSTASLFYQQITTDPFAAPLGAANKGIGTIVSSALLGLLKNPWVLLVLVLVGTLYFWPLLRPFVSKLGRRS